MKICFPARGLAACAVGHRRTAATTAVSSDGRRRRISSLEHIPSTKDSVDTPARVARLPRRAKRPTLPSGSGLRERLAAAAATRAGAIAGVGALVILSALLRVRGLGIDYWIDEGLSVGIGSHALLHIPGLLHEDGSPPLYYMLLHVWMGVFGKGEWATQSLSTLIALLTVPAAFWAGDAIAGRRAAWAAAALMAVNPFLTLHSYEARMYALMTFLGLLATAAFVLAFAQRRTRWRIPFGVLLALMLYTHNWSLFFAGACVLAAGWLMWRAEPTQRRNLVRDSILAFSVTVVAYLPWVPTLIYQALHTGAPWALR